MQSICYLHVGVAETCGTLLWWQWKSLVQFECSLMSPHHPMALFAFPNRLFGELIPVLKFILLGQDIVFHYTWLRFSFELLASAVSCLEFLHALDLPDSLSFSLCCRGRQCTVTWVISYEYSLLLDKIHSLMCTLLNQLDHVKTGC